MPTIDELIALADALGASMVGSDDDHAEPIGRLGAMFDATSPPNLLVACLEALGNAWDARAARVVLDRVRPDHDDPTVRRALARNLPCGIDEEATGRDEVIAVLLDLTVDVDDDVRDWSCFGLRQLAADSPSVRDALAARLEDAHADTRCEALVALAGLGDARAKAHLEQRRVDDPDDVHTLELEAAAELADPDLHAWLLDLQAAWEDDEDDAHAPLLAFALLRCHPDAPAQAQLVEEALVAAVADLLDADAVEVVLRGAYPRSTISLVDRVAGAVVDTSAVWPEEEPWSYPVEQMAQTLHLSHETATR